MWIVSFRVSAVDVHGAELETLDIRNDQGGGGIGRFGPSAPYELTFPKPGK